MFFLGGVAGLVPESLGVVILKIGYFAAAWLMLYFMYKKNVFPQCVFLVTFSDDRYELGKQFTVRQIIIMTPEH